MQLGELLVGRGLVSVDDMAAVRDRQQRSGGKLGEVLIELKVMTADQFAAALAAVAYATPPAPRTLEETGIAQTHLLNLLLRFMSLEARESAADLARAMKLPYRIVQGLVQEAAQRKWLQPLGARPVGIGSAAQGGEIRYALSGDGRGALADAMAQSLYLGPAPVPLEDFQAQVAKQSITDEFLTTDKLIRGLNGLVIPDHTARKLLPAVNAGRSILLFGPPGNGKTSVAVRLGALYEQIIYVPYAVEIAGQIMRVFDPGVHRPALSEQVRGRVGGESISATEFDDRWVPCRRPFAMAGGELTLDMLDLQYDAQAKFYDAPLHVKALNGVFLIDDFGRQRINPMDLLNRWIVPMENRVDYLTLHSGKTFSLPFDEMLVFSTNIDPREIMDAALLRRIPYKIKLYPPDLADYKALFENEAEGHGLLLPEDVFDFIVQALMKQGDFGLAYFQPKFICQQAVEMCRSFALEPRITRDLATEALANLYVQLEILREPHEWHPPG